MGANAGEPNDKEMQTNILKDTLRAACSNYHQQEKLFHCLMSTQQKFNDN